MSSDVAKPVEFIRLGGHMVRATNWTAGADGRSFQLVTITRGTRDAEMLDGILASSAISLEIPDGDSYTVAATSIDRREFGDGQARITRFGIELRQVDAQPAAEPTGETLEERVLRLEQELAALRVQVEALARSG